jgi:hypothetical protein
VRLSDIAKLCEEATPGPWRYLPDTEAVYASIQGPTLSDTVCSWRYDTYGKEKADASFIAASRTLLPKLLAVAEAAKAVVQFTAPEWRDDIDRGDADTKLAEALAALEKAE